MSSEPQPPDPTGPSQEPQQPPIAMQPMPQGTDGVPFPPTQYGAPPGQYGQPPPPGYGPHQAPPGQHGLPPGQPGYGPSQGVLQGINMNTVQNMYAAILGQSPATQPAAAPVQWMSRPDPVPGCPPGLEYLCQVDQLLVQQQVEILEMMTGWETANRYKILNTLGQQVYFAAEGSGDIPLVARSAMRGFVIHIMDNHGQEVIQLSRDYKSCTLNCCACSDCCAQLVTVQAPVGQVVGFVRQKTSCCTPKHAIMDANMDEVLSIEGPATVASRLHDVDFVVSSKQGVVGKISKQWSGLLREVFTDADNFGVSFPMDLDVKLKAVMLGAVFLIDFMYYESAQPQHRHHHRRY